MKRERERERREKTGFFVLKKFGGFPFLKVSARFRRNVR